MRLLVGDVEAVALEVQMVGIGDPTHVAAPSGATPSAPSNWPSDSLVGSLDVGLGEGLLKIASVRISLSWQCNCTTRSNN